MRTLRALGTRLVGSSRIAELRRHIGVLGLAAILGLVVSAAGSAHSALPPAGAISTSSTFGSSLTVTRPATTSSGDVLLASVDARLSGAASITPPAGWSLIRRDSSTPGYLSLTQALYYKVAGSSEPAAYSWSLGEQASAAGAVIDFKNVDATSPVDAHSGAFTPGSGSMLAPSITTSSAGDDIVGFFSDTSSRSIRPPALMTEEFEVDWMNRTWTLGAEGSAYIQSAAGATGDMTARTSGHPSSGIGQLVGLRTTPPPPPPPPPPHHPRRHLRRLLLHPHHRLRRLLLHPRPHLRRLRLRRQVDCTSSATCCSTATTTSSTCTGSTTRAPSTPASRAGESSTGPPTTR